MLYSQLHTGIRRALFGTVTIFSTGLSAGLFMTTTAHAQPNTVNNPSTENNDTETTFQHNIRYFNLTKPTSTNPKQTSKTANTKNTHIKKTTIQNIHIAPPTISQPLTNDRASNQPLDNNTKKQNTLHGLHIKPQQDSATTTATKVSSTDALTKSGDSAGAGEDIAEEVGIVEQVTIVPIEQYDDWENSIANELDNERLSQKAQELEKLMAQIDEEQSAYQQLSIKLSNKLSELSQPTPELAEVETTNKTETSALAKTTATQATTTITPITHSSSSTSSTVNSNNSQADSQKKLTDSGADELTTQPDYINNININNINHIKHVSNPNSIDTDIDTDIDTNADTDFIASSITSSAEAIDDDEPFSHSPFASFLVPNVSTEASEQPVDYANNSTHNSTEVIDFNDPQTDNYISTNNVNVHNSPANIPTAPTSNIATNNATINYEHAEYDYVDNKNPVDKESALTNKLINNAYEFYPPSATEANSETLGEKFNNWFTNFPNNSTTSSTNNSSTSSNNQQANNQPKRCIGQWVSPKSIHTQSINQNAPVITTTQSGEPITADSLYAIADYAYSDNVNYAELQGNAFIQQGQQQVSAERIIVDLKTRTAQAEGQVMFNDTAGLDASSETTASGRTATVDNVQRGGIIGVADKIAYSSDSKQAKASDIAFASVPMQAHGFAKSMEKTSDAEYNLQDVIFSTCPPTDRTWQIESSDIQLNTETGRGETYNTTLKIKEVPVLYLPYFNFPIDGRRTTGFLLPRASLSTETGLEVSIPYYLNLAPNYDATISTRIFTDRNPMLTGEFRYLTDGYGQGRVVGSFLPKDKEYDNKNRSSLFYEHNWQSEKTPNLTATTQYNYLSDSKYNDDFDYLGVINNNLNLPRNVNINYYNDYLDAQFKAETYQRLDATDRQGNRVEDKDRPYDRLPQITLDYELPKISQLSSLNNTAPLIANSQVTDGLDNIKITGSHDTAYFRKSITDGSIVEQSGLRMYNKVSASYPYTKAWGYIEPKVSLQHLFTTYDEDARKANNIEEEDNSQSVFVPQFSIDAMARFEKQGSPTDWIGQGGGGYQLLSPRLKYTYAPYKSQNEIPNFNTRVASINYEQLFADSWFLGHDRLQDLHAITPGVNYRYIDEAGLTRLDASIAQQYYLDAGEVTLDDAVNSSKQSTALFDDSSSGLVSNISAQPYDNLWVDVSTATKSDYDLSYFTSQLRYQPTTDSQFSFGMIERKQDDNTNQLPLSALTASAIFPVNDNWRVISQTQYDYEDSRFLDTLFGVDYEDCCIGFSVYGRRYYNELDLTEKPTEAIMAELRLKGITSGGGRLSKLLSEKVLGIGTVNSAWKRASY